MRRGAPRLAGGSAAGVLPAALLSPVVLGGRVISPVSLAGQISLVRSGTRPDRDDLRPVPPVAEASASHARGGHRGNTFAVSTPGSLWALARLAVGRFQFWFYFLIYWKLTCRMWSRGC